MALITFEHILSYEEKIVTTKDILHRVSKLPFEDREKIAFYAKNLLGEIYFHDTETEKAFPHIISFLRSNRSKETLEQFFESGSVQGVGPLRSLFHKLTYQVLGKL